MPGYTRRESYCTARVHQEGYCPGNRRCSGDEEQVYRESSGDEEQGCTRVEYTPPAPTGRASSHPHIDHLPTLGPPGMLPCSLAPRSCSSKLLGVHWHVSWALFLNPSWVEGPGVACSLLLCLDSSGQIGLASHLNLTNGSKDRMRLGYLPF